MIESNLPEVAARLGRMPATLETGKATTLTAVAESVKAVYLASLALVTPRGETSPHLADTGTGDVVVAGDGATITFRQTKTVAWRDHGDYPLARILIEGVDHDYPISAIGKDKGGADALFWEGAKHPVKSVIHKAFEGYDYPQLAIEDATPGIDAVLAAGGTALLEAAWRA